MRGGFLQVVLAPVNFDLLLAHHAQEAGGTQAQEAAPDSSAP